MNIPHEECRTPTRWRLGRGELTFLLAGIGAMVAGLVFSERGTLPTCADGARASALAIENPR